MFEGDLEELVCSRRNDLKGGLRFLAVCRCLIVCWFITWVYNGIVVTFWGVLSFFVLQVVIQYIRRSVFPAQRTRC